VTVFANRARTPIGISHGATDYRLFFRRNADRNAATPFRNGRQARTFSADDFSIARRRLPVFTARVQANDSEIEEVSAFFRGWRVEVIRLGPRRDQTLVSCAAFRTHRVLRLDAGSALVVRGAVHKARSCVLLSASQDAAVGLLGQPLCTNDLVFAGAGARMDLFVPTGAALFVLVVGSPESISRRALRICDGANAGAESVATLIQYITEPDQRRSDIDRSLASHLRHALTMSRILEIDGAASTRVSAVVSACQLVDRTFPAPITLSDLSRHCGVAERTLEYGFRQVYGTTPLTFIRSQRLTRSRMALLHSRMHTSISETARACGFTHMGQFSHDYRMLFGESPSATLQRARQHRSTQIEAAAAPAGIVSLRT
jgi:AraC-like DNA-binding protein